MKISRPTIRALLLCAGALVVAAFRLGAQDVSPERAILARAGTVEVTEKEFRERFELTPGLYRQKGSLQSRKEEFLISLVAEKLLAQEALARGLDVDSLHRLAMLELTRLFARDALYRQEVSAKVSVSDAEVRMGMQRSRSLLRVTFLFSEREDEAAFVRSRISAGKDLDAMRFDSSLALLRDTATVIWGDADTTIENAAYGIAPGALSPVVHAGEGYYILRLDSRSPNPFTASLQPDALRQRVIRTLRERKERVRMQEFVDATLRGSSGFSPPSTFKRYARAAAEVLSAAPGGDTLARMTPEAAEEILRRCADVASDTLIVAGRRAWSVTDATAELLAKGFTVQGRVRARVPGRLYDSFGEWVVQELLAQEALRRGLDRLPEVQEQVAPWRDQTLASMMRAKLNRSVAVNDAEVAAYLRSLDPSTPLPMVRIRELRTSTLEEMRLALSALDEGLPFEEAVVRYSRAPDARATRGATPFFAVTDRPPLGAIAAELSAGERFGPVRDSAGYVIFEVLEKQNERLSGDSARAAQAVAELLRMKQRRKQTLFVAQSAAAKGFEIYDDRLAKVNVTSTSSVVYRFIGFGGRMFAVPFVQPDVEWISEEPPRQQILP